MTSSCHILYSYLWPPPPSPYFVILQDQGTSRKQGLPDSKVRGANMGPTGPRLAPCGPREPCYLGCHTWKTLAQNHTNTTNQSSTVIDLMHLCNISWHKYKILIRTNICCLVSWVLSWKQHFPVILETAFSSDASFISETPLFIVGCQEKNNPPITKKPMGN